MRPLCWLVILAPLAIVQAALPASHSANVTVIVFDTLGFHLPGGNLTLTGVYSGEKFTTVGGEAKFQSVPLGTYDLDVSLPGFIHRKERVEIGAPKVLLRIGVQLGTVDYYESADLSVFIRPDVRRRKDLWVRLVPLYSSDLLENAVDSSGHVELVDMPHGKYLLLLLEKDKVLATKSIDLLGGKHTVELTLQ